MLADRVKRKDQHVASIEKKELKKKKFRRRKRLGNNMKMVEWALGKGPVYGGQRKENIGPYPYLHLIYVELTTIQ